MLSPPYTLSIEDSDNYINLDDDLIPSRYATSSDTIDSPELGDADDDTMFD